MLEEWSASFGWVGRAAVHDAEVDYTRKQEMARQVEAQAREDARLLHSIGAGALGAAATLINDLIDPTTGAPKRPASARDVQPLVRAGIACLVAACGTSPEGTNPNAGLHKGLDHAPADVRPHVLTALRALSEWRESSEGRRG
jgi:hypothetical protein